MGQHQDRVAVRPREALRRGIAPRQPREPQMLARREAHRRRPTGTSSAEDVLDVVRRARRRSGGAIAGRSRSGWRSSSRRRRRASTASMPVSSRNSRAAVSAGASPGSWLPVTDCQMPGKSARSSSSTRRSRSVNDDQRGKGLLGGSQATKTQNGTWRSFQNSAASARMSSSVCPLVRVRLAIRRRVRETHDDAVLAEPVVVLEHSASASQLLPKCSGSASRARAPSSSVAFDRPCRGRRRNTCSFAAALARRDRVGGRMRFRARPRCRRRADRAASFADPPERLVVIVGVEARIRRVLCAAAHDAPRAAVVRAGRAHRVLVIVAARLGRAAGARGCRTRRRRARSWNGPPAWISASTSRASAGSVGAATSPNGVGPRAIASAASSAHTTTSAARASAATEAAAEAGIAVARTAIIRASLAQSVRRAWPRRSCARGCAARAAAAR